MDPGLMCLIMIAAIALVGGGVAVIIRKARMSRAMQESCMLCDGLDVHVRNRDGEYRCGQCGFDTDLEVFPPTTATIGHFRDLKNAIYAFEQGLKAMKWAQAAAVADAAGGRSGAKYQKMEEASKHMIEGFSLLKDLLTSNPDLLEMPVAGETISNNELFADIFIDNIVTDIIVATRINESKKQIEAYVHRLHALNQQLRGQILGADRDAARKHRATLGRRVREADDDDLGVLTAEERRAQTTRNLVLAAGTLAVLAAVGGAGTMLLTMKSLEPQRVLIAVAVPLDDASDGTWWGEGGMAAAAFNDRLATDLIALGFDVVPAGDPDTLALLEGARTDEEIAAAAKSLGAGQVVRGRLTRRGDRELAKGRATEIELGGEISVLAVGEDHEGATIDVSEVSGGSSGDEAANGCAREIAEGSTEALAAELAAHPSLVELFERESRTSDEVKLYDKLRPLRAYIDSAKELRATRASELEKARQEWKKDLAGDRGWTEISRFDREELLIGVLPADKGALLTVKDRFPTLSPGETTLGYRRPHERIEQVSLDGKSRKVLLEAYNIYSYPHVSADGSTLALVTDDYGRSMTLRILDIGAGKTGLEATSTCLRLDEGYLSSPRLSPDGERLLFYRRDCRRCPSHLELIDADGNNRETIVDGQQRAPLLALWAGNDAVVYGVDDEGVEQVHLRKLADKSEETLLDKTEDGGYRDLATSPKGDELAWLTAADTGAALVVMNLESRAKRIVFSGRGMSEPSFSGDGKWLAVEVGGPGSESDPYTHDAEVAVVKVVTSAGEACGALVDPPAKGEEEPPTCDPVAVLTSNPHRDRYPRWAPDKMRLFTETSHPGLDKYVTWMSVRWTDVSARP